MFVLFVCICCLSASVISEPLPPEPPEPPLFSKFVTLVVRLAISVLFVCICCRSASVIPEPLPPEPPLFSKFVTLVVSLVMFVVFVLMLFVLFDTFVFRVLISFVFCSSCFFCASVIPPLLELPEPSKFLTLLSKSTMFVFTMPKSFDIIPILFLELVTCCFNLSMLAVFFFTLVFSFSISSAFSSILSELSFILLLVPSIVVV